MELAHFEEKRGILLNLFKFTHSADKDLFLALIEEFCQNCEKVPQITGVTSNDVKDTLEQIGSMKQ